MSSRATTTAEADARLISKAKDVNVPGFTLVREWPFINATYADTLSTTLDAVETYTNPWADGQEYPGTFVNSRVEVIDDSKDGIRAPKIRQTLVLVASVTIGEESPFDPVGLPTDPIITQENEILDALGIETGEEDTLAFIYNNLNSSDTTRNACSEITDSYLQGLADAATTQPDTGWIYVDRKMQEQEDKTLKFLVIFKQVVWQTWGHDSYAADVTDYSNVGSDDGGGAEGEAVGVRKTWLRIRKADLSTATSDCQDNTVPPLSGYIVTGVDISDARDGSITVTQTQVKQIDAGSEAGVIQLNPHGLQSGLTTNVVTVYRNFNVTSLPTGATVTEGGNVISNIPSIQGDGLWSREVITRVPAWTAEFDTDKERMSETNVGGYQVKETDECTGIGASEQDDSWINAQTASGATRSVLMTRLVERANGERVISRTEGFSSVVPTGTEDATTGTAIVIKIGAQVGNKEASLGRVWWRRTLDAKNTLIASGGNAVIDFEYNSVSYTHTDVRVDDNGDGTYNVFQVLTVPLWNYSVFGTRHNTTSEVQWKSDEVVVKDESTGTPTKKDRVIYRYVFASYGTAIAYVDAGTGGTLVTDASTNYQDANGVVKHMGYVEYLGTNASGTDTWAGYNVQLT